MKTPKLCKPNREMTENTACLIYGYETPQQKCEAAGGRWNYDTILLYDEDRNPLRFTCRYRTNYCCIR